MAATDFDWASTYGGLDVTVKNTDSVSLAAYTAVKIDATNILSGTQQHIGVLQTTTDDKIVGFMLETVAVGKTGRVRFIFSAIARGVASAAITAGGYVQASTVGKVKAAGTAKPGAGMALTTTASDGDPLLIGVGGALNA